MATIVETKINIGKDAYGRQVTASRRLNYDSKLVWEIKSLPMSQRDEGESMGGLSDSNMLELAEAVAAIKGAA